MPNSTAQPFSQCSPTEKPEHKHRLISETTQQPKGHLGVLLADFRHVEDGRLHVDQHILETLWATGNLHDPKGRGPRCFKRLRGWSCLVRPWSGSDPKFQRVISAASSLCRLRSPLHPPSSNSRLEALNLIQNFPADQQQDSRPPPAALRCSLGLKAFAPASCQPAVN